MRGFFIRVLITALGLWIASAIVPGVSATSPGALLIGGLVLGILNASVRPVIVLLTFPITLITLGLFLLVVNAAMLGLAAAFVSGLAIDGFGAAVLGAIVVSLTSMVASWYVGANGRIQSLDRRTGQ